MASPGTRLELKLLEVRLEYLKFANSEAAQKAETTSKTQQELQRIHRGVGDCLLGLPRARGIGDGGRLKSFRHVNNQLFQ